MPHTVRLLLAGDRGNPRVLRDRNKAAVSYQPSAISQKQNRDPSIRARHARAKTGRVLRGASWHGMTRIKRALSHGSLDWLGTDAAVRFHQILCVPGVLRVLHPQ